MKKIEKIFEKLCKQGKKRYFSQFIIHTSLWCIKCSWCSLKKEKLLATKTENKLIDLRQDKEFKSGRQLLESMRRSGRW